MRVLIYHRIDGGCCDGMSRELMELHLRNLKAAVEEQGHTVVGEFYDFAPGCSLGRPGLESLLKSMESGIAEGVMVKDLSRLARDRDAAEQIQSRIRKADGCLLSVDNCLCSGGYRNG